MQVVFDVTGYTDKDLKISVEGDEFTLDGEATNEKGGKKTFQKAFGVPPDVKVDETTAKLSADGWLVFTVPRKVQNKWSIIYCHVEYLRIWAVK